MDSTGNVDRHSCRVFLLMTHSAAGELPIGCFLTTCETRSVIEGAFEVYKSMLTPDCFAGRGVAGPLVVMTDACAAERSAIKVAFPGTVVLLCTFHVLQATWRWLWDAKHGIPQDDRPEMFGLVKQMMYSSDAAALDDLYATVMQLRRSTLRFFHSHSSATGVFCLICRTVYFRCAPNLIAASGEICIRRLKVGDLLIQIVLHCALLCLAFLVLGRSWSASH